MIARTRANISIEQMYSVVLLLQGSTEDGFSGAGATTRHFGVIPRPKDCCRASCGFAWGPLFFTIAAYINIKYITD